MENGKELDKDKKGSNKKLAVGAIIILILGVILILNSRKFDTDNPDSGNNIKNESNKESINKYQTKTDSQSSVTIEVTPKSIGADKQENIFELSLNTHSVDLNYDFQKVIILKDNLGNKYEALEWTGGEGGHHMDGEIIFPGINKNAKIIEMEIDGVGGVKRSFKWNI